jgi:hypothetical protein
VFHLARRFLGYVTSNPPSSGELDAVRTQLGTELFELFIMMNPQDQRHAIEVAHRVEDVSLVEAALLHDVGKSASHVGAVGRSFATIASAISIPVSGSWDLYLDLRRQVSRLLSGTLSRKPTTNSETCRQSVHRQ